MAFDVLVFSSVLDRMVTTANLSKLRGGLLFAVPLTHQLQLE